jgi:hypothetical protein
MIFSFIIMKTYLFFFFFIQLLYQNMSVETATSAVCFLTINPALETLQLAEEIAQDTKKYDIDVYVMIDNDSFDLSSIDPSSHFRPLKISKEKCVLYGYRQSTRMKRDKYNVTSWDKGLLYFCVLNQNYSFVWLIENDVFIPSVQAFRSIHQLYSTNSDLVVPRSMLNLLGNTSYWHWALAAGKLVPPWSRSMVNIVGLSRRMLTAIAEYIRWRGVSIYHEFFFNTLAIELNMTMVTPVEFSTNVYRRNYTWEQIRQQPNNFWHPMKDPDIRHTWRQRLVY